MLKQVSENRSSLAFIYPRNSYSKLKVLELIQNHADSISKRITQQEESCGIFYASG
jgi:hypothetical protein